MSVYDINGNQLASIYAENGAGITKAYDIDGNMVFTGTITPTYFTSYTKRTVSNACDTGQGFAYKDGILCHGYSTPALSLLNMSTNVLLVNKISIDVGHADSINYFLRSNEILVTQDTNPCVVTWCGINSSNTSITVLRNLYFGDVTKTGYYAANALMDDDTLILVGYTKQSYTDATNNSTIVSLWNLSSLTKNSDETYTPAFIESFEIDFLPTQQGLDYRNGILYITYYEGNTGNHKSGIYGYDMINKQEAFDFYDCLDAEWREIEGIAFMTNTTAYVDASGGAKYIFTFSE